MRSTAESLLCPTTRSTSQRTPSLDQHALIFTNGNSGWHPTGTGKILFENNDITFTGKGSGGLFWLFQRGYNQPITPSDYGIFSISSNVVRYVVSDTTAQIYFLTTDAAHTVSGNAQYLINSNTWTVTFPGVSSSALLQISMIYMTAAYAWEASGSGVFSVSNNTVDVTSANVAPKIEAVRFTVPLTLSGSGVFRVNGNRITASSPYSISAVLLYQYTSTGFIVGDTSTLEVRNNTVTSTGSSATCVTALVIVENAVQIAAGGRFAVEGNAVSLSVAFSSRSNAFGVFIKSLNATGTLRIASNTFSATAGATSSSSTAWILIAGATLYVTEGVPTRSQVEVSSNRMTTVATGTGTLWALVDASVTATLVYSTSLPSPTTTYSLAVMYASNVVSVRSEYGVSSFVTCASTPVACTPQSGQGAVSLVVQVRVDPSTPTQSYAAKHVVMDGNKVEATSTTTGSAPRYALYLNYDSTQGNATRFVPSLNAITATGSGTNPIVARLVVTSGSMVADACSNKANQSPCGPQALCTTLSGSITTECVAHFTSTASPTRLPTVSLPHTTSRPETESPPATESDPDTITLRASASASASPPEPTDSAAITTSPAPTPPTNSPSNTLPRTLSGPPTSSMELTYSQPATATVTPRPTVTAAPTSSMLRSISQTNAVTDTLTEVLTSTRIETRSWSSTAATVSPHGSSHTVSVTSSNSRSTSQSATMTETKTGSVSATATASRSMTALTISPTHTDATPTVSVAATTSRTQSLRTASPSASASAQPSTSQSSSLRTATATATFSPAPTYTPTQSGTESDTSSVRLVVCDMNCSHINTMALQGGLAVENAACVDGLQIPFAITSSGAAARIILTVSNLTARSLAWNATVPDNVATSAPAVEARLVQMDYIPGRLVVDIIRVDKDPVDGVDAVLTFPSLGVCTGTRLTARISLGAPPPRLSHNQEVAVATVAATMSGAGPDLQSIAALGLMACTPGANSDSDSVNVRALVPIALSNTCTGAVQGGLLAVACAMTVSLVAVAVLRRSKELTWGEAASVAQCPSVVLIVCSLVQMGLVVCGGRLVVEGGADGGLLGVLGLVLGIALFPAYPLLARFLVSRRCFRLTLTDAAPTTARPLLRWMLPEYTLDGKVAVSRSFAHVVGRTRLRSSLWAGTATFQPILMLFCVFARPGYCSWMFALTGALFCVVGITTIVFRPHRIAIANVFGGISLCLNGVVVGLSARLASDPLDYNATTAVGILSMIQTGFTVVRTSHMVLSALVVRFRGTIWLDMVDPDGNAPPNGQSPRAVFDVRMRSCCRGGAPSKCRALVEGGLVDPVLQVPFDAIPQDAHHDGPFLLSAGQSSTSSSTPPETPVVKRTTKKFTYEARVFDELLDNHRNRYVPMVLPYKVETYSTPSSRSMSSLDLATASQHHTPIGTPTNPLNGWDL